MGTSIYYIGALVIVSVILAVIVNNWARYRVLSALYVARLIIPLTYLLFAVRSLVIEHCPGFMCFFPSYMNYGMPWSWLLGFITNLDDPKPLAFISIIINFLIILSICWFVILGEKRSEKNINQL
ncbi:MAG: hypothetical protein A3H57_00535 [Candidatus Taylorbacteria bacterium RIFCSPLOWO2_02_FULL_43_11]|uniref:Uncharacterized protein n=1 Tax=Candidatus Taylorbacteria bacterium RIFCSPHIGHO2_02_FULL_43_32b TaxID=1802306 RepID=A0A1G2MMI6_9BACT|nr:MAG: hypothetical protein A2743_02795 [Candidatus Taylorbacteria bacterium RIFCSPHIGHO2_01_FULL_43_47]OHA25058.1 MAG: hypothetical protein A3C72_03935 [Candidatus Taylorbacteria bacterium RIFCSPHIGHO2_02_FULL_43_32b]OHA31928.1 MAG: hypothetical protein A3B08_02435 [Candidatus Taylorbacteria bacterium RIFCSPLOWO2_01_FULL_43_44]OHA35780.1 MAG: hypothetical protein A3H57_00535 [Candidatus Taylorbacteria bacterium RIFCSPLOWO2_02_FULL_43_11]